jgi:ribonuclease inhibitor
MTHRCVLDFAKLRTEAAVYDVLVSDLPFPDYFGRNLDALWDSLTCDVPGPIEIVLRSAEASPPAMRSYIERLLSLLRDAARERADLRVIEE